jgi:hypothetical protein
MRKLLWRLLEPHAQASITLRLLTLLNELENSGQIKRVEPPTHCMADSTLRPDQPPPRASLFQHY